MGVKDVILCDTKGIIYEGRPNGMNSFKEEMARITNKEQKQGSLADALVGADVFVGVSAPGVRYERNGSFHECRFNHFCYGKSGT